MIRFIGYSSQQTFAQASGRRQLLDAQSHLCDDSIESPKLFGVTFYAFGQTAVERASFGLIQHPEGTHRRLFGDSLVIRGTPHRVPPFASLPSIGAKASRNFIIPSRVRVLTVPRGWFNLAAISLWLKPE